MQSQISGLLETVVSSVRSVLFNVRTDPTYRSGFVWGLITALVIGAISRQLRYWWDRVLQLFEPSKEVSTRDGPTAIQRFSESVQAFVLLILFIALLIVIARWFAGIG